MPIPDRRSLVVVFITLLIVFEAVAYVATTPRPTEQFFQIYVLGSNRMAADYYPNNNPNIQTGDEVSWYTGVTNFMGSVQLVVIRVRLGNQTTSPPDDTKGLPSTAPMVTEFKRFLLNNETWEFPFTWRITKAGTVGSVTRILELGIGNQTYTLNQALAANGYNFRFIIELWTLNVDSNQLQFGWFSGTEHRVAWLQIWFNATTPRVG